MNKIIIDVLKSKILLLGEIGVLIIIETNLVITIIILFYIIYLKNKIVLLLNINICLYIYTVVY
jgi:hypothetical protein